MTPIRRLLASLAALAAAAGFAVAAAPAAHATGTHYYFAASGSDSNDCLSTATPCLTLGKASTLLAGPGDRVSLRRGDSWAHQGLRVTASGTALDRIVIDAYADGTAGHTTTDPRPKITGGVQTSGFKGSCIRLEGSLIDVDNIRTGSVSLGTGSCSDSTTFMYGYGVNSLGDDNRIMHSSSEGNAAGFRLKGNSSSVTDSTAHDSREHINTVTPTGDDSGTFGVLVEGDYNEVAYNTFYGNRAASYDYGYDGSDVELFGANFTSVHHNVSTGGSNGFSESGKSGTDTNSDNTFDYNVFVNSGSTAADAEAHGITIRGSGSSYGPNERYYIRHNTIVVKYTGSGVTDTTQAIGCSASCPSSTVIQDNILVASYRALYDDNASSTVAENVYQGAVDTITMPAGNISADPQLVSDTDAHLTSSSPAIDAASSYNGLTDAFGVSVPQDGDCSGGTALSDIGAAEYDPPGC